MTRPVIRVGVVDEHPLARYSLIQVLEAAGDVVVVGEASDGTEALELVDVGGVEPNVILLDMETPRGEGLEVARAIAERDPTVGVILLVALGDPHAAADAVLAGARGYLVGRDGDDVLEAVRRVAVGEVVVDARLAPAVAHELAEVGERTQRADPLTAREMEILELFSWGHDELEIARRMRLSPATVSAHLRHIHQKLQAADRTATALEHVRRVPSPTTPAPRLPARG